MAKKEYILKQESNGTWYSYPTGNWYGRNIDEVFKKVEDDLNNLNRENQRLKKENNELKGNIINSLKNSRTVKCNCNPCVAEETVIEMLMESKK